MLYWTALVLGLAGNFHCLGMCGPIALAMPLKRDNEFTKIMSILTYNAGRILIYAFFGVLFGMFGKGVFIAGWQQRLSIFLGIVIVLSVLFPLFSKKLNILKSPILLKIGRIKSLFQAQFKKNSFQSIFTIGLLNGLLPCGLVFMAIAGATTTSSWEGGMLYMTLFGLGTLPVMLLLPYFGHFMSQKVRLRLNKIVPVVLVIFGVLLIVRGANLGIPYLSPEVEMTTVGSDVVCH